MNLALTRLFPLIGFQIITESSSLEDLPCLERKYQSIRQQYCNGCHHNINYFLRKFGRRQADGELFAELVNQRKGHVGAIWLRDTRFLSFQDPPAVICRLFARKNLISTIKNGRVSPETRPSRVRKVPAVPGLTAGAGDRTTGRS
jgi:hypothetical protein